MSKKSPTLGNDTLVEVTNISQHGFWLLFAGAEYFVPFDKFPWFREHPVRTIHNVVASPSGHFHWPDLDVDLSVTILTDPEKFPLVSAG